MAKVAKDVKGRVPSGEKAAPPSQLPTLNPHPLPLWLWPLLGALLLAPLRAGQFERVPVAAVNALVAAALLLYAWRPGTSTSPQHRMPTTDPRLLSPTLWLGVFLGLNLLSMGVSIYHHATLTALLDLAALLGAYWLVAQGGRRIAGWIVGTLLVAGLLASALALREYASEAWSRLNDPGWRAFGPFFKPNLLASIAIHLAPLALALMLRAGRTMERAAASGATLVLVAALLVSGSRGGTYALIVGALSFPLFAAARGLKLDRRRALATLGLLLVLLPVAWLLRVPLMGRLAKIPGTPALTPGDPAASASERSNAFRVLTWKATLKIIAAKPLLGTGAGTFEFALPGYSLVGYTQRAHQSYLQIAAEVGIPALLAWLVALALTLSRLLASRKGGADWLLPGIGAGLVAAMAHNVVDYSWSVTGTALPFWALLGLVSSLTGREDEARPAGTETPGGMEEQAVGSGQTRSRKPESRPPTVRSSHHRVIHSSVASAGVLLLVLNVIWLQAAQRQAGGRMEMRAGDPRAAVNQFQAATALTPLDASLQIDLAGALGASGDAASAEAALRRAAALAPTWGRPYYVLGRLLEREGRLKEAEAAFEAASERDPRNTQPLERLAAVREASGDHAGALSAWQRVVAIAEDKNSRFYALDGMTDPIPGLAYEALGREEEARGRVAEAVRHYRAGAERLRQWRLQRPRRQQLRAAQGEGPSEREADFQHAEIRLWERLAALSSSTGHTEATTQAQREAAAAQAAARQLTSSQ